jgi:hypothetical protein
MYRVLVVCVLFIHSIVFSQPFQGVKAAIKPTISQQKGASCAPPNKSTYLQYNNVRAMIHTAGNMWQIPGQNFAQYEVPKNSGIMALFTSALWLGGKDVNGQLKLAALRYREGADYWTGPLSNDFAEIDAADCYKYDNHYMSSQDLVREFDAWFAAGELDDQNGTNIQNTKFPNYKIPDFINDWPAHGDVTKGQDYYLAPFFDRDNNGTYEPSKGDYPWYDITGTKDCKTDRRVSLYGDFNLWWVMNDKGNIHTESGGEPIGMEIRAQAFAFATNDDINNMTFYNYELINRGTQTLFDTYFGIFIDGALGNPFDDYVGCDVNRGLGYVYNGFQIDADNNGYKGYGASPPAVGVDFFEGPYQDNDSIDNAFGIGINEALNGIGYGDGIVDNERFGMRRFLYYINSGGGANPAQTDPTSATDYYNFLQGKWKDNTPFYYGGSGHISDPDADATTPCDFMFPGDTDPQGWGTNGIPKPFWTEQTAGNLPYDRRFLQSAGPFVLTPGAINNITVGVVWARSPGGDPFASVKALQRADDKAQALFENCFKVLEGPHAPDLAAQELDREVILYLSNDSPSNNTNESYKELDPFIVSALPNPDKYYRFQGYMIYQLASSQVSVSDLSDPTRARLAAQCDKKDGVARLINFEYDEDLEASIPVEKVDGANDGIKHSFRVTTDLFATGDKKLVNFKRYYYLAIAYAHNNYEQYNPTDPNALTGQKLPFLASRKAAIGEVKAITVIPHKSNPEANGTAFFSAYGLQPEITRIDGRGNGMNFLNLTQESEEEIITTGSADEVTYAANGGPINVKIVDPLNVVGGYFTCKFYNNPGLPIDSATWVIYRHATVGGAAIDSVTAETSIAVDNEQLIPQWGISVQINNIPYYAVSSAVQGPEYRLFTDPIAATMEVADSTKNWLSFVSDDDSFAPTNWIRSGTYAPQASEDNPVLGYNNPTCFPDNSTVDPLKKYAKLLNGGITHFSLVGRQCAYMPYAVPTAFSTFASTLAQATLARASSVDIVFTNDRSKWTRCAVLELCADPNLAIGNAEAGTLREQLSVDKNGNPDGTGTKGMSWFPGYAIDLETGKRLHMAFGENSFLGGFNGSDMKWNPTSDLYNNNMPVLGGQHPVYVFGVDINGTNCPAYDGQNNWVYDQLKTASATSYRNAFTNCMWVVNPLLTAGKELLSTTVRIKLRINKEYERYTATGLNNGLPMYAWGMDGYETKLNDQISLSQVLKQINVVPNPYYAFSEYERNKVDQRIKIINLPEKCTVTIYNVSGKLINQFKKDNAQTFIDWNLINRVGIPISSGVYIIHIDVPNVGETVRKAFIAMRAVDLQGF